MIVLHIIVCIALILIVLLQTGKGAEMGAAFGGGGGQALFGSSGATTFLSKATTMAAILFMITSLGLAYLTGHQTGGSIMMEHEVTTSAPIEEKAVTPAAEPAKTETTAQPAETQQPAPSDQ
ncbi:preprotein translocase subunit SecG [Desulfobacterales bacterium HSG16]|nr:preprotein translocase subunit SecG [Desulfobacterales bacterium HSG16]